MLDCFLWKRPRRMDDRQRGLPFATVNGQLASVRNACRRAGRSHCFQEFPSIHDFTSGGSGSGIQWVGSVVLSQLHLSPYSLSR